MRPHISFIDPTDQEWVQILGKGVERKFLGVDPDTGSDTCFVRIPPGWAGDAGAHIHTFYEEAYIISGDINLNGHEDLVEGSYLYRPGGIVHGWVEKSREGATVIIKMGGPTDIISVPGPDHEDEYDLPEVRHHDGRPHIIHLRTKDMGWTWHEKAAARFGTKILSEDSDNKNRTFLLNLPAGFKGRFKGDDDRNLECAVVHGALNLEDGTEIKVGSYFHHHPHQKAPPIASSVRGCTALMWSETPT